MDPTPPPFRPWHSAVMISWGAVLLFMATLLATIIVFGDDPPAQPDAWRTLLLFLLPVAGLLSAKYLGQGFTPPAAPWPHRVHQLMLLAVLLLAGFLRLFNLGALPLVIDPDSAQNGFTSMILSGELLARGEFSAVLDRWALGNEAAFLYLQGLFQRAFGVGPASLRLPSALAGLATVYALYRLGLELFSRRLGLVAAAMLAISPWHIALSRLPKRPILTPLFMALALIFLARALRAPSLRRGLPALMGCGLCVGAGLHGYEAFRLVPLVIAAALLSERLARRAVGRGLAELGIVAAASIPLTLPLILFALEHPEVYLHHVTSAALDGQQTGVAALANNAALALEHFLYYLHSMDYGLVVTRILPALLSAFYLLGLGGLALAPRRGHPLRPGARAIVFSALAVMALVLLLTGHKETPRRPIGLLVPYFLLAAGVSLALLQDLARRLPRRLAGIPALCLGTLLLLPLPGFFKDLGSPSPDARQAALNNLMRWVSEQADTYEVYLSPSVQDKHQLILFHLHHPRIHRIPTHEPLPNGPLERDALVVTLEERWKEALVQRFGADLQGVPVPRTLRTALRAKAFLLPAAAVSRLRQPPATLGGEFTAKIVIPRTGAYRFRASTGRATLQLDQAPRLELPPKGASTYLTAGLHGIHYSPATPGAKLIWRRVNASRDEAVPAGALWSANVQAQIPAPRIAPDNLKLLTGAEGRDRIQGIQLERPPGSTAFQDLTRRGETYYFLDGGAHALWVWSPATGVGEPVHLRTTDGRPFSQQLTAQSPPHSARTDDSALRIAATGDGFVLLDRVERRIHRFTADGRLLPPFPVRLELPMDLTAGEGVIFVADLGRQAILSIGTGEPPSSRAWLSEIHPVALDYRAGRLAVINIASHSLDLYRGGDVKRLKRIPLGQVGPMSSVSLDATGNMVVTHRGKDREYSVPDQIHIYSPDGALLATDSNPDFLSMPLRTRGIERFQAVDFDLASQRLVVLCEWVAGVAWLKQRSPAAAPGLAPPTPGSR